MMCDAARQKVRKTGAGQRLTSASRNFLRFVLRSGKILMQNYAILRNALRKRNYESPGVSNDMQSSETLPNSLGLNYRFSRPKRSDRAIQTSSFKNFSRRPT